MFSTLLAYREKDYDYLYDQELVDLNDLLHQDLWLVDTTIDTAFENLIMESYGYEINIEDYFEIDWVKEMKSRLDEIKSHIEYDNRLDNEYSLWNYGQDLVKITLQSGETYTGRMYEFDDSDLDFAWLTLKEQERNDLIVISFNEITGVVKVKSNNIIVIQAKKRELINKVVKKIFKIARK
ncbi:hypothetical protein ACMGE5_00420 [Macrococcus equi]|uniref:hypothetical protein n=1 Tax=Macrococcus equi TaxID=3395462 RepID=UPI0039BDD1F7